MTVSIALFFIAWEVVGRSGQYAAIKPVTAVMPQLWSQLTGGTELLSATVGTLGIALVGYVIAVVVGVTVGYMTASSSIAASTLDPLINAAYATPIYMVIPVLGIYAGLEFNGKVFLVVMFAIFVVIINTSAGVRQVPPGLLEMASSFRLTQMQKIRRIILPSASPFIATGMRLAVGLSVQGAIVGELLLRVDNLGLQLLNASSSFQIPKVLAISFFIAMLATATMLLARLVERRVIRWPQ
ncbi:MAG: binding-protein-dependent transporter inner rane component [Actinotalea sp.]|nr:binding-protein-dependent transporter inner rane component [Actinotalea sp.]